MSAIYFWEKIFVNGANIIKEASISILKSLTVCEDTANPLYPGRNLYCIIIKKLTMQWMDMCDLFIHIIVLKTFV